VSALKKFPMGVGPPVVLGILYRSSSIDLTTVTGVTLYPLRPDGTQPLTPWAASIIKAPDEDALTPVFGLIQYPFQVIDVQVRGIWFVQVVFTVPSGFWPNKPELTPAFQATDQWGR
jgi:hypothetical protein